MKKYRIICPKCGEAVITTYPEMMVWERCPQCRTHVWDAYDVWMADVYPAPELDGPSGPRARARN